MNYSQLFRSFGLKKLKPKNVYDWAVWHAVSFIFIAWKCPDFSDEYFWTAIWVNLRQTIKYELSELGDIRNWFWLFGSWFGLGYFVVLDARPPYRCRFWDYSCNVRAWNSELCAKLSQLPRNIDPFFMITLCLTIFLPHWIFIKLGPSANSKSWHAAPSVHSRHSISNCTTSFVFRISQNFTSRFRFT